MRARWQQGSIRLEGKHVKVWVGRYLEDEIVDGQVRRVQKSVRLGTKEQLPTERAARRELQKLIAPINATGYRPKHKITFKEFCEKWERDVLPQFKPAGRASTKSNLKGLKEYFGSLELSAICTEVIQRWITLKNEWSPKTVSNYVTTLQRVWKSAKAWGYVTGDPFENLVLPKDHEEKEQPSFSPEQIQGIIDRAPEPYKTMFWIVAETGIRGGELCGLFKSDVDLDAHMLYVRRSAFQGKLQTPKTGNSVRAFPISELLCDHLRAVLATGGQTNITCPSNLLFVTPKIGKKGGCPYDNGNIVKRALKPILREIGIDGPRVGLHSLRHSNASAMDSLQVPMQVRLDRLGHGAARTTMMYTHSNSQDHRIVAEALGRLFAPKGEVDGNRTVGNSSGVTGDQPQPRIDSGETRGAASTVQSDSESLRASSSRRPVLSSPEKRAVSSETVQSLAMGAD